MIAFSSGSSFVYSFYSLFTSFDSAVGGNVNAYLFSGEVPQSLDAIGWDTTNPFEISKNSQAMIGTRGRPKSVPNQNAFESFHSLCFAPIKKHKFESYRDSWRLAPSNQYRYDLGPAYGLEFPGQEKPLETREDKATALSYQTFYGLELLYNERYVGNPGVFGKTWKGEQNIFSSVRPFEDNKGLYIEFEQDTFVDGVEINQYRDSLRGCSTLIIEYWDEENQQWIEHTRVGIGYDLSFVSFEGVTASKFIVSGLTTSRWEWSVSHISLFSSQEPSYGTDTVDITWALLTPAAETSTSVFDTETVDTLSTKGSLPLVLCSVGDLRDSDHALVLNQSKNLKGYDMVRCLGLNLEFSERSIGE